MFPMDPYWLDLHRLIRHIIQISGDQNPFPCPHLGTNIRIFPVTAAGLHYVKGHIRRSDLNSRGDLLITDIDLCITGRHLKGITSTGYIIHRLDLTVVIQVGRRQNASRLFLIHYHLVAVFLIIFRRSHHSHCHTRRHRRHMVLVNGTIIGLIGTWHSCQHRHIRIVGSVAVSGIDPRHRQQIALYRLSLISRCKMIQPET